MNEIELNQAGRAKAISSFLDTKRDTYLKMISKTRQLLTIYMGQGSLQFFNAEDIMHEIFSDIIDGTRTWDMDKWELEQVLWNVIYSEVSNLAKKERRYIPALNSPDEDDTEAGMDKLVSTPPNDIEGSIDAEAIENYCMDVILKDNIDAQIVFNEMITGKKQKQIAEYLGISIIKTEDTIKYIRKKIKAQIPFHLIENLPFDLKDKLLNNKQENL